MSVLRLYDHVSEPPLPRLRWLRAASCAFCCVGGSRHERSPHPRPLPHRAARQRQVAAALRTPRRLARASCARRQRGSSCVRRARRCSAVALRGALARRGAEPAGLRRASWPPRALPRTTTSCSGWSVTQMVCCAPARRGCSSPERATASEPNVTGVVASVFSRCLRPAAKALKSAYRKLALKYHPDVNKAARALRSCLAQSTQGKHPSADASVASAARRHGALPADQGGVHHAV